MNTKILCIGANTSDTDRMTEQLSLDNGSRNHGLIAQPNFVAQLPGYYHTSPCDLTSGQIILLAEQFDKVLLLDQDRTRWPHHKDLQTAYKIMIEIDTKGIDCQFLQNQNVQSLHKISAMVRQNPSFCIYPWINFVNRYQNKLHLCTRSNTVISDRASLTAWHDSRVKHDIKAAMLNGQKTPQHCGVCYDYEQAGIESYRQYESQEWLWKLGIDNLDDVKSLTTPKYYEVHWSDRCNLKCRGCTPDRSTALQKEFAKHQIQAPFPIKKLNQYSDVGVIDVSTLDHNSRVYVSGGEPVIMKETLDFMGRCIKSGRTDFELTMSTNGQKFPENFTKLSRHFPNLNLSFSIDGYEKVNDYWRSGSQWETVVANMHIMADMGHRITLNTVPGIYNVTNLHKLFEWADREFSAITVYLQLNRNPIQSVYNHPDAAAVVDSMLRCQQTSVYWCNGKSCKTTIDSILQYYQSEPQFDLTSLKDFFEFNDKLDRIRNIKLADYIPELELARQYIT